MRKDVLWASIPWCLPKECGVDSDACLRHDPFFVFPADQLLRNRGVFMVWFLLMETKTVPIGRARRELER